jgi:hypothetical protein
MGRCENRLFFEAPSYKKIIGKYDTMVNRIYHHEFPSHLYDESERKWWECAPGPSSGSA